jgi:hypothetical protein
MEFNRSIFVTVGIIMAKEEQVGSIMVKVWAACHVEKSGTCALP